MARRRLDSVATGAARKSLKTKPRADLPRTWSTRPEHLGGTLRRQTECPRVDVEVVSAQIRDIEHIEDLAKYRDLVAFLKREHFRQADILRVQAVSQRISRRQ